MLFQGQVLDPSAGGSPDGSSNTITLGRANEMLVAELHGKYFEQCYRGNVFYASTATTGVVIPISSTLTPVYTIWNPAGSGKLCVPIVTLIGWTATTAALGSYVWMATTKTGDTASTIAPITAFTTPATPINAFLGSGKVSQMRFGNGATTITLVAAASFYRETGCQILVTTAASSTAPGWTWRDDWDGSGIIPPGNAIHLMAATAILTTVTVTTVYEEVPL